MTTYIFVCQNCRNEWREKVLSRDEIEEVRMKKLPVHAIRCPKCGSLNIKKYN